MEELKAVQGKILLSLRVLFYLIVLLESVVTGESNTSHCSTARKVTVDRTAHNFGFHRNVATKLEWLTNQRGLFAENEASCKFMLKEYLPKGIYVDLDQIKVREEFTGPKVFSKVRIDVEAPAHKARGHEIFVFAQANVHYREDREILTADVELPVHLRYQMPQKEKTSTAVFLNQPKVFVQCTKDGEVLLEARCKHLFVEAPCDSEDHTTVCQWLPLYNIPQTGADKKELDLEFSVPVGRTEHKIFVIFGTIVSTMAGALYILCPTR